MFLVTKAAYKGELMKYVYSLFFIIMSAFLVSCAEEGSGGGKSARTPISSCAYSNDPNCASQHYTQQYQNCGNGAMPVYDYQTRRYSCYNNSWVNGTPNYFNYQYQGGYLNIAISCNTWFPTCPNGAVCMPTYGTLGVCY